MTGGGRVGTCLGGKGSGLKRLKFASRSRTRYIRMTRRTKGVLGELNCPRRRVRLTGVTKCVRSVKGTVGEGRRTRCNTLLTGSLLGSAGVSLRSEMAIVTTVKGRSRSAKDPRSIVSTTLVVTSGASIEEDHMHRGRESTFSVRSHIGCTIASSGLGVSRRGSIVTLGLRVSRGVYSVCSCFRVFLSQVVFYEGSTRVLKAAFGLAMGKQGML